MRTARGKYLGEVNQEGGAGVCSSRGSGAGERTMKKNLISAKIKYGNPIRECWRGAPNRAPTSGPCGKFAFSRKPPLAPFPPGFPYSATCPFIAANLFACAGVISPAMPRFASLRLALQTRRVYTPRGAAAEGRGSPAPSVSIFIIFPAASAHFLSRGHISVVPMIFQTCHYRDTWYGDRKQ